MSDLAVVPSCRFRLVAPAKSKTGRKRLPDQARLAADELRHETFVLGQTTKKSEGCLNVGWLALGSSEHVFFKRQLNCFTDYEIHNPPQSLMPCSFFHNGPHMPNQAIDLQTKKGKENKVPKLTCCYSERSTTQYFPGPPSSQPAILRNRHPRSSVPSTTRRNE